MSGLLAKLGQRVAGMPDQSLFKFAQTMSVVLMPSLLPLLRYQFDEPTQKKKLFVRDFTGGGLGEVQIGDVIGAPRAGAGRHHRLQLRQGTRPGQPRGGGRRLPHEPGLHRDVVRVAG